MENTQPKEDRRNFLRIKLDLPLEYTEGGRKKQVSAQIIDISANGIGLELDHKLSSRLVVDLTIEISDDKPLRTEGEVIWVKRVKFGKYHIGIKLQEINLMGISRILNTQRSHAKLKAALTPRNPKQNLLSFLF